MKLLNYMKKYDYEQLVFCQDKESNLSAIIAIHDTTLGPALGGTRMWPYKNEEQAVWDVLCLSRAMTYKAAAAGLALGGGKAVIIGDPCKDKTENLLRAYGRFIETLKGRYITAEDVGVCQQDMDIIHQETKFVTGISPSKGGSGDPSPFTALGVLYGMKAAAGVIFGSEDLTRKHIAVQGTGKVGYYLCRLLASEGAHLIITDLDKQKLEKAAEEFRATIVTPEEIYRAKCDIFAPCALGAVINDKTIGQLKCRLIAGAANNVLAEERHGDLLHHQGVLYVPDYVINAGGLINVAEELHGYNYRRAMDKVAKIYNQVLEIIDIAKKANIPTYQAANQLAEERIRIARQEKRDKQVVNLVG